MSRDYDHDRDPAALLKAVQESNREDLEALLARIEATDPEIERLCAECGCGVTAADRGFE